MKIAERVRMIEVGPRDGLQNEAAPVSIEAKVTFIEALVEAGITNVESGSFVSPRWVPQMADTAEVLKRIRRVDGVSYPVLVPNTKGMEAAIASGVSEVAIFAAASESFSRRNINCSIAESLDRFRPVCEMAAAHGIKVRGYVSCVLGCPYEGEIDPKAVAAVSASLMALGCYEISLGDTIGVGTPTKAQDMLTTVASRVPIQSLAVHFHDTYGQALANILACLELGVTLLTVQHRASVAVLMLRGPAEMSRLKTSCTCSMEWALRQASIWRSWWLPDSRSRESLGASLHRASVAYSDGGPREPLNWSCTDVVFDGLAKAKARKRNWCSTARRHISATRKQKAKP